MSIKVKTKQEAWNKANEIFPTDYEKDYASSERAGYDIYRHPTLNYYNRICDLGNRLEVLTGEYGENVINIWIVENEEPKVTKATTHLAINHYTVERGNSQYQLQLLAEDVLNHGERISECHHTSLKIYPDGTKKTTLTGSYCIEVLNKVTSSRYWVHFSGCKVTEIVEEYLKD